MEAREMIKDTYKDLEIADEIATLNNNFNRVYLVDAESKIEMSLENYKVKKTDIDCRKDCIVYKTNKTCICNDKCKRNSIIANGADTYFITSRPLSIKSKTYNMIIEDKIEEVGIDTGESASAKLISQVSKYNNKMYLDELTGAYTRKFIDKATDIINTANSNDENVCLAYLDIDNFKHFNDGYGHDFGDLVLKTLVDILKKATSNTNGYVIRQGGDEFMVLMIGMTRKQFILGMTNICRAVYNTKLKFNNELVSVSISVGCSSSLDDKKFTLDELISTADKRLYISKDKGKNCVT